MANIVQDCYLFFLRVQDLPRTRWYVHSQGWTGIVFLNGNNRQPVRFLNSKVCSLNEQKKKPARIRWTVSWRRNNKKGEVFSYSLPCLLCRPLRRASAAARSPSRCKELLLECLLPISRRRETRERISPRSLRRLLLRRSFAPFFTFSEIKNRKAKKPARK